MFRQELAPVAGSLYLSALIALFPLLVIFVLLAVLRLKAYLAGLAALAVAVVVAATAFGMPVHLALLSATEGAVFGLFPIMWIVFNALWVFELTVVSGRFEDLRASFNLISPDPRIMALLIAFCFGALLEALAGFGAPVLITAVMLMAIGFSPFRAAAVVLVANTAPVAFGAIAIPILTASGLTGLPVSDIGAVVGRQAPILALFVPFILVFMIDGGRGVRQTWPGALVCGASFSIAQFLTSNYISVEMTDIVASLFAMGVTILFLRMWHPRGTDEAVRDLQTTAVEPGGADIVPGHHGRTSPGGGSGTALATPTRQLTRGRIVMALLPYVIIIVVFAIAPLSHTVSAFLTGSDIHIGWPGLNRNVLSSAGKPVSSTVYNFQWLSSPGTLLLICGIIVAALYRLSPVRAAREYANTAYRLRWAFLTVASVLALAYVMNLSGQTLTIGNWIASTGPFFAFLAPMLGWLGTAVTGSDTSANALFSTLQQAAAQRAGLDQTLLVAANTSGGVVGKMISPQNLTIAATAVGIMGREGDLFRYVVKWSVGLLLFLCVLVYLQSTPVLGWMLP